MPAMEQVRVKRAGLGLRGWDQQGACPGLTLFAPHGGDGSLYLIDLRDEVVHKWHLPCPAGHGTSPGGEDALPVEVLIMEADKPMRPPRYDGGHAKWPEPLTYRSS
jgi:hypothetical protein